MEVVRCVILCLVLGAAFAGCGEKGEPETPDPEPGASHVTQTAIANAPPGIRSLEYGKYCGEETLTIGIGSDDLEVPVCIVDSIEDGSPAWGTVIQTTVEGDPIPTAYVARSERDVLVLQDSTEDRFGSRNWVAYGCLKLSASTFPPRRCARPITVDEKTPAEFLERETFLNCGRLGISLDRLASALRLVSPALECFQKALERGEPAELFARSVTEEGPVEYYFRVTGDGGIERFTDATRGGTGPRTWYREECERISAGLNLHSCSEDTDLKAA